MTNFIRGSNTSDYWQAKHQREYDVGKPHNFSQLDEENSQLSYHKVASDLLQINKDAIKRKSLLELGSSVGFFTAHLKENILPEWNITGIDFSEVAIQSAKEQCPSINYECKDILLEPIKSDYGIICMFETLEHFNPGDNTNVLNNALDHCEYCIVSVPTTKDDCRGEHLSHYDYDSFEKMGYDVVWKAKLSKIDMSNVGDFGDYFYFIVLLKGKLSTTTT